MSAADHPLHELFQACRQGLAGAVRSVLGPSADVQEVLHAIAAFDGSQSLRARVAV